MRKPSRNILPLMVVLLLIADARAAGAGEEDFIRRGLYFVDQADGIAMWIPGWVNKSDRPRSGMAGEFGIKVAGHFLQMYVRISGQTVDAVMKGQRNEGATTFQTGKLEVIERLAGCLHPTSVAIFTDIDAVSGFEQKDYLVAVADLEGRKTVSFHIICAKGKANAILPVVKWMASSVRWSGEAGIVDRTGPRRLEQKSGLSYRLPRRFEPVSPNESEILAAEDSEDGERLSMTRAQPEDLDAWRSRAEKDETGSLRITALPHSGGAKIHMVLHPPEAEQDRRTAEALITFPDGPTVSVRASGKNERRNELLDAVETTAMGLKRVDVKAARARAATAAAELEEAIRKDDRERTQELIDALATGSFLPDARVALEKALPRLDEPEQVLAVEALVVTNDASIIPALIKLYRASRFKKRYRMRRTVLESLRYVQDPAALKLLLAEADDKETALAATSIYSMGHYKDQRAKVVRKLVPLFKRAEAAGRSSRIQSRERWVILQRAYQSTLKRLTGETIRDSDQLQDWFRANKSKL